MADPGKRSPFRPRDLIISEEDVEEAHPTPPYRRYPASVHSVQSPPYRSRSQVDLTDESLEKGAPADGDAKVPPMPSMKPTVHYPDDLHHGPAPGFHNREPIRFDSGASEPLSSRAPSLAGSDDEEDEAGYDWSDEDDLLDEEAKYEKQMGVKRKRPGCSCGRVVAFFLSTLIGSVITSGLLVAAAILVRVLYYQPKMTDHRKYVTENVEAWLFWAASNLIVSWILGFIIDIIPGIFTWVIFIVWGHINEKLKSRVELYNSVDDTVKPAFYAAAAWVSWVILFDAIYNLYDMGDESQSRAPYTPRVGFL